MVAALGCGGKLPATAVPRPFGEDLVAMVPTGAELVVDIDVQQLRVWDATPRLLSLLPPTASARLERLGKHWMNELDSVVAAAWRGERGDESVVLVRGDLDDARLGVLLDGDPERGELYGRVLYTAGDHAALRLAPRVVAFGSAIEVRRVADVMRGDLQGLRDAKADQPLREALARAPTAKTGRPAVIAGAIGGPLVHERLDVVSGGRRPRWAAFALAVGDGVDAVLVLGMSTPPDAVALFGEIDRALRDMRSRPFVRLLGLGDAFDVAGAVREKQLKLAYRIAGERLERFLGRMADGKRALEAMKGAEKPSP